MNRARVGPCIGPNPGARRSRVGDPARPCNAELALCRGLPGGPGYPRAVGRVAPLAQVRDMGGAPRLAHGPWPPRRGHDSYLHKLLYLEFGTCILSLVLLQEQDSARLWSLWAKAGAVGNAQRCPRQVRRCAAGASSTNPPPASVWRCSSASSGDEPVVDPVTELGAQRQSLIGSPNGCLGASVAPVQFACSTRMGV